MVSDRAAAWYDRFLYVVMDRRGPALLTRRDAGVILYLTAGLTVITAITRERSQHAEERAGRHGGCGNGGL